MRDIDCKQIPTFAHKSTIINFVLDVWMVLKRYHNGIKMLIKGLRQEDLSSGHDCGRMNLGFIRSLKKKRISMKFTLH